MTFDPYAELDVDRKATKPEIERAYRKRAKKTHPDRGGTADSFHKTNRAVAILSDPKRRRAFDETGNADDVPPDNTRAAALAIIDTFLAKVVQDFINDGCAGKNDPRTVDLFAIFREQTNSTIFQMEVDLIAGEKVLRFIKDMADRFSTTDPTDPVGRAFSLRLASIEGQRASIRESIEAGRLALKIAATYRFRYDEPAPWVPPLDRR